MTKTKDDKDTADTKEAPETQEGEEVIHELPPDTTEAQLRSWGISGQPVSWADERWQPLIASIRAVNLGELDSAVVTSMLTAMYPDAGYDVVNIVLPFQPCGEFAAVVDVDDPLTLTVTTDDENLNLPAENIQWSFGDGTPPEYGSPTVTHTYAAPGEYTVRSEIVVAGSVWATSETFEIGAEPEAPTTRKGKKDDD